MTRFGRAVKRLMPRTLFGRSLMIIVTPAVLVQIVATYVFYDQHWHFVTRRLAQGLAGDIATVIDLMAKNPTPEAYRETFTMAERHNFIYLSFLPGATLPDDIQPISPLSILDTRIAAALRNQLKQNFQLDTVSRAEDIVVDVQLPDGVLHVVTRQKRIFSSAAYVFVLWMVGVSVILTGVAILFQRNQVRSIRRLAIAAESFGKGRDIGFRPEGATEVRQAGKAFLEMRDRIQRQISQRTEMLAGVSHDLRTPLTRMKLELALLGDADGVDELKSDVDEMEAMVEGYLEFARGQEFEPIVITDVAALLGEIAGDARRQGDQVNLETEPTIVMPLRPQAFKRCVTNLVDNARRHAGSVWIGANRHDHQVEITVEDDGPGIPASERERVFRAFHRLDESRNRDTGGSGLGLTIARDVVRSLGGEIHLGESTHGGLKVKVRLPL